MQRITVLLGIGCLVVICSGGMWLASWPPIQGLPSLDASHIQVLDGGWWEWTLTYRTSDPPHKSYLTVVQQLRAAGWVRMHEWPLQDSVTYMRITWFKFVVLWERVELNVDAPVVHVRMRRWITLLW